MATIEPAGGATPAPGAPISIGVEASLRPALHRVANGRCLVIDARRSRSCCASVGDLFVALRDAEPGAGYTALAPVAGVPLFCRSTLLGLLRASGPALVRGGLPFRRGITIQLARPEPWIDWLERPTALQGPEA